MLISELVVYKVNILVQLVKVQNLYEQVLLYIQQVRFRQNSFNIKISIVFEMI